MAFKHTLTILIIALLVLSLYHISQEIPVVKADSPTLSIFNIQTRNNSQGCFYFCRGVNSVEFDVSIANNGSSITSGLLTITMLDNCRVPIEDFQSQVFSVYPGENETIEVSSGTIPTYAFVGIATAQVILQDPSTQEPISFESVSYYIGNTINPIYVFSGISITPSNQL